MSSVGNLLLVVCDKLYIYHMYVYHLIWDNESFCAKKNWRRLTAGMYTANCEIWRGKCNGVWVYFL